MMVEQLAAGTKKTFVKNVRAFHAVFSVALDLEAVRASVEELVQVDTQPMTDRNSHVGNALLTHAVITYARATHSKAVARFNVGVVTAYNSRQREMHNAITNLRDKCFAHFGPGNDFWNDERVVYLKSERGHAATVVHRRVNYRQATIESLKELVSVAIPHLETLKKHRAEELHEQMRNLDEDTWGIIRNNKFDVDLFFEETPEIIKNFWEDGNFSINRRDGASRST